MCWGNSEAIENYTFTHIFLSSNIVLASIGVFLFLMMAMPVLTGFLTLVHYGSVFRITSIRLFCVFLAMFLREYLSVHQDMTRVRA